MEELSFVKTLILQNELTVIKVFLYEGAHLAENDPLADRDYFNFYDD